MKITIAIPILNEEKIIPVLYKRLRASISKDFKNWKYEIIFVDDGSIDNSFERLKELRKKDRNIKIIQLSRNFGHHIALTCALDYANGDYVVLMDGDLQNKPEEIIQLYKKLQKGYDIVYGIGQNKNENALKKINSIFFHKTLRLFVKESIEINSTIFRIMSKQVVDDVKKLRESNRYLIGIIGWVGYKTSTQKVSIDERYSGGTKYTFSKQLNLALDALFSFSTNPMRLFIKLGVLLVFSAFIFSLYAIYRNIFLGSTIIGWTSIVIILLTLGGFQIILLGLIGEYVSRVYTETKNRPLYIISRKSL